jgi:hypothetical protein
MPNYTFNYAPDRPAKAFQLCSLPVISARVHRDAPKGGFRGVNGVSSQSIGNIRLPLPATESHFKIAPLRHAGLRLGKEMPFSSVLEVLGKISGQRVPERSCADWHEETLCRHAGYSNSLGLPCPSRLGTDLPS